LLINYFYNLHLYFFPKISKLLRLINNMLHNLSTLIKYKHLITKIIKVVVV